MEPKAIGHKHDDGRSMLKPAHLIALFEIGVAGEIIGATILQIEICLEAMQPDAGNQYGRNRHKRNHVTCIGQFGPQQRSFVHCLRRDGQCWR